MVFLLYTYKNTVFLIHTNLVPPLYPYKMVLPLHSYNFGASLVPI